MHADGFEEEPMDCPSPREGFVLSFHLRTTERVSSDSRVFRFPLAACLPPFVTLVTHTHTHSGAPQNEDLCLRSGRAVER